MRIDDILSLRAGIKQRQSRGGAMGGDLGAGALSRHIGSLYGGAVRDQPRDLHARNRVPGLARNFAGGRGRRLPVPISERRRYPIEAVNGAPETSVNAGRPDSQYPLLRTTRGSRPPS
jgi:hypothetical protein